MEVVMITGNKEHKILDEKATLRKVKEKLVFLEQNIWMMEEDGEHVVEDAVDLMDFLPYTKSIIQVNGTVQYDTSSRVVEAMQRKQQALDYQQQKQRERIHNMQVLLYAIRRLPPKESACITKKYTMHQSYQSISMEMGISQSSVGRYIQRGCFHLAQLLHLECYQD